MKRAYRMSMLLTLLPVILSAQAVRIAVDAGVLGEPIDPLLYGINTARWDESLFPHPTDAMLLTADRDAIGKIKESRITLLKYPGGNDADAYIWNAPDNSASEMDTDEYIALCRAVDAEPFITINFNASAELAAEWVRYCNVVRGYDVKLWEVGDEQWGTWAKGHAPPDVYAKKYISFVKAMRAVDPTIKVATNVPLGPHPENWTTRVLQEAADYIDMITFTFFPQKWGEENDESLLATVPQFRKAYLDLRKEMDDVLGNERAARILTVNVGYNSVNHSPGPQTLELVNALWTADMLGVMAETGVDIGCFWALHNAFPPRKGDYGYLSSEGLNTPSFSFYVFPMLAPRLRGTMVSSSSSNASVSAFASLNGHSLAVVLVNKDRGTPLNASVDVSGFTPSNRVEARVLSASRKDETFSGVTVTDHKIALTLPPFSVVTLQVPDKTVPASAMNVAVSAVASASTFSTIGPHFTPKSAHDGLMYTKWNSAAWTKSKGEESQWFKLSWNEPQRISKVVIRWGSTRAVDFSLETSVDGQTWKSVYQIKDAKGEVDEIEFGTAEMRHIRMNGTRGTNGISAYSISEIEVY